MADELIRKNIQVSLEVYQTLTDQKRGNQTYTDVLIDILGKAGIPLSVV
jgi:predicted CopG family antitoxin